MKPLACRLFGHQFYWLDVDRQCHCQRCGTRNDRYFERQAELEQIFLAAPTSYRTFTHNDAQPPHPNTMIGRR